MRIEIIDALGLDPDLDPDLDLDLKMAGSALSIHRCRQGRHHSIPLEAQ
jgi:hypothetical protein